MADPPLVLVLPGPSEKTGRGRGVGTISGCSKNRDSVTGPLPARGGTSGSGPSRIHPPRSPEGGVGTRRRTRDTGAPRESGDVTIMSGETSGVRRVETGGP